jgi:aminoglycoside phosphotransferase (APT) family kinase protein
MDSAEIALATDQLEALCERAFGPRIQIESSELLRGGTFNTTYLVTFSNQEKVILRIAPPETASTYWEERLLMRREHSMQPFFAPIASSMPRTLMVDFTHQLLDRDYMFQSFVAGERWDDIVEELTPAENGILWDQFGEILKRINQVRGEQFGLPLPGMQFHSWSQTVLDRLERTQRAAQDVEIPHLVSILELIRAHPEPLDEIQVPRLLHGDLWLFNMLVTRDQTGINIAGILDADRSWWGDPMADWTMFILRHAEEETGHSRFWKAYGQPDDTPGAKIRAKIYDAMHAATAFLWAIRHRDDDTVARAQGTLGEVVAILPPLIKAFR